MKNILYLFGICLLHSWSLLAQADLTFESFEQEATNYIPEIPYSQIYPNGDGFGYLAAGTQFKVLGSIKNIGTSNSGISSIGFYLSTDNTLQTTDVQIGTISTNAIAAGHYYFLFKTLSLPANTAPGIYSIIAKADNANSIAESNENNNVALFNITVLSAPDLVPNTVGSPATLSAGNSISLICEVKNNGLTAAPATRIHYFLYDQSMLNLVDLGYSSLNPLAVNASVYRYPVFTVPVNTPPATYSLYFVADGDGVIQELNEQNNAGVRTITITAPRPDLTVFSATVPTTATAGSTITGNCQVKNVGSATANSSMLRIYLSNNNTYSSNDIMLSSSTIGTTAPNGSYYRYPTLNIPNSVSGICYLLFQADANNQVIESNENNNITVRQITINPSSNRFATTGSLALLAYPNPTTDVLNVQWKGAKPQQSLLTMYNANGQTVIQQTIYANQGVNNYTLNMKNLTKGMYVLILDDQVVRVVKQ